MNHLSVVREFALRADFMEQTAELVDRPQSFRRTFVERLPYLLFMFSPRGVLPPLRDHIPMGLGHFLSIVQLAAAGPESHGSPPYFP